MLGIQMKSYPGNHVSVPRRERIEDIERLQQANAPHERTEVVEALLRELVEQITGLRVDIARQPPPSHLARCDRDRLARILPAVAGVYGSTEFTSRDLAEDASSAVRLVLRGLSVKSIGRLLARADGIAIDNYVVQRCGVDINVALWRIVATC